ncbi:hypothetical protein BDN67DRAFT_917366 [Paxillus ammoniavirescens]|nr:hypothetical protein BDN67DRAFT_917366 [Paxillus ammoniavirescens]
MRRVGSLDYAQSVPWEWFHLLLENIITNLVDFWTGRFKDLDSETEDFEIAPHIWEEVRTETAVAVQHIPASFVCVLSNIASDHLLFTAESWCFWFIYLAPKLLENRFARAKYYKHMCELVEIMQITLQFSITVKQVDKVEKQLIQWVEKYEKYVIADLTFTTDSALKAFRYYYQYRVEHLPACTLTIHGLLHLGVGIKNCSPVWTTWTSYMERFCGMLQNSLQSRSRPWSNLNNSLLHMAYLEQLGVRYDLSDKLGQLDDQPDDGPIGYEQVVDGYPGHVLHPPYKTPRGIDPELQQKIANYIGQVLGKRSSEVKPHLPPVSFLAGKLRIRNGGDTFRTKQVSRGSGDLARRNCYVRYEVVFQPHTGPAVRRISYGDLEKIFVLTLPADVFFRNLSGKTLALTLITPWDTEGKITSKEMTFLKSRRASIVTDIRSLRAVVGLVESQKRWGIVDRVPETVVTSFTDGNVDDDGVSDDDMLQS